MPNISLHHYLGFHADKRVSMDIYADSLLKAIKPEEFALTQVRPKSRLERWSSNRVVMRYLRYRHYPRVVEPMAADLHHVLDHGYAHLHRYLKGASQNAKTCITVHDLIPMLTWNGHIRSANGSKISVRKPWLGIRSLSVVNNFDRIIAVSESTRRDLVEHLGIQPNKIDVIPPVIQSFYTPRDEQSISDFADKYGFDRRCKWIMVSGREFYKNHRTSLEVLAELNRQHDADFRIVKTGLPSDDFDNWVDELGLHSKVKTLFLEDNEELVYLYGLIDCLLFPSLYEGFGMPVVEALACGTPAVVSDRGSLPEVSGSLAAICNSGNVQTLSQEVISMVFDKERRLDIAERGPKWVDQFRAKAVKLRLNNFYNTVYKTC